MKAIKMVGMAVAAFGLASFAMAAGPLLVERGVAMLEKHRAVAKPAPTDQKTSTQQKKSVVDAGMAAAQETASLPQ